MRREERMEFNVVGNWIYYKGCRVVLFVFLFIYLFIIILFLFLFFLMSFIIYRWNGFYRKSIFQENWGFIEMLLVEFIDRFVRNNSCYQGEGVWMYENEFMMHKQMDSIRAIWSVD